MAFISSNSTQSQQTTTTQSTPTQSSSAEDEAKKNKNLIILVEKDSNDKLNELFDKTLGNKLPLQVPFNMRKLPASFFKPPSSGSKSPSVSVSHSRENSADSAFGSGTTIVANNPTTVASALPNNGLQIHHSRAHSSPASLGKLPVNLASLSVGNSIVGQNASVNANTTTPTKTVIGGAASLVTGAGNSVTNSNSTTPTNTTNSAAVAATSLNSNNNLPHNIINKTLQHIHSRGRSYDIPSLQQQIQFGELPSGWEQAKTHDGKIYYINHNARTTQWEDPRIQLAAQALNQNSNLFSEQSSVETLFSSQTLNSLGSSQNANQDWAAQEQTVRLFNLQLERERLRRRQQEIKSHIGVGEDPFLSGITDHTRQESGDSGLSVSMSHTPDFLSSIDDSMDGLSVTDNTMDTITFSEAMETPDEFMLNDPLLLEKIDAVSTLMDPTAKNDNTFMI
jgi:protein yorkie